MAHLNIECGQIVDTNAQYIDTTSLGTLRRKEGVMRPLGGYVLFTDCPINRHVSISLNVTETININGVPGVFDEGEARQRLLSGDVYKCNKFKTPTCPFYSALGTQSE